MSAANPKRTRTIGLVAAIVGVLVALYGALTAGVGSAGTYGILLLAAGLALGILGFVMLRRSRRATGRAPSPGQQ